MTSIVKLLGVSLIVILQYEEGRCHGCQQVLLLLKIDIIRHYPFSHHM